MLSFKFSRQEVRDAIRLATQSASAACVQFSIMRFLGMPELFVGTISAVLVLEPTIGNTLKAAQKRFVATLVGCGVGLLCFLVIPAGYGTAVALSLAMFLMNGLAGLQPQWRYGVVAAVALALKAEADSTQVAIDRSLAIGLGVLVGSVASLLVWPEKSSTRSRKHLDNAVHSLGDYLQHHVGEESNGGSSQMTDAAETGKARFASELSQAKQSSESVRLEDDSSLQEDLKAAEQLHDLAIVLQQLAAWRSEGEELTNPAQQVEHAERVMMRTVKEIEKSGELPKDDFDKIQTSVQRLRQRIEG